MGEQHAMPYTLAQAGKAIGKNKTTVLRAIKAGKLSAARDEATSSWMIEPSELHRLYPVAAAAVHAAPNGPIAAPRNGHATDAAAGATPDAPVWRVQLEAAEARIADRDDQITDLRRRLDRAEDERHELLTALNAAQAQVRQLTDQRSPATAPATPDPPRTRWGRLLRALGHAK
jgi:hypothetical protein